ncbi:MAG: 3-dehydroquinate synthase [Bacteroidota bacterium]|nr:3-dehydroquinate synthase [Bacteroidota bacterium]
MKTITVSLGKRSYPICIGAGIRNSAGKFLQRFHLPRHLVIVTDTIVARLYLDDVRRSLERAGFAVFSIVIPPGESQKSLQRAGAMYTELLHHRIGRKATIVALGGGVVGDLAGFIAATYQRGVNFMQMPTTLLAQVDSSVGGKVGINHPLGKNMIGAFYQPLSVLADTEMLQSLPQRERVCGIGEVIKYGIILDKRFFEYVRKNLTNILAMEPTVVANVVARCCELKAFVVSRDEKEENMRAILNFGHTVGHALEQAGHYRSLKHGEAILLGMVAETFLASRLKMISAEDVRRIEEVVAAVPVPRSLGFSFSAAKLIETMRNDKKSVAGTVRFVLPERVGAVTLPMPVKEGAIAGALDYLEKFVKRL